MKQALLKNLVVSLLIIAGTPSWANEIDDILSEKSAPAGIVFEIVGGEAGLLDKLLPVVKKDIKRLRDRFPDIPIAIVSHGTEQFALTIKNQSTYKRSHTIVKELVTSNKVDVHVCGTHAGWYGVMPEDFPDYVDVAPAGPAQINHYEELGYELIVLP